MSTELEHCHAGQTYRPTEGRCSRAEVERVERASALLSPLERDILVLSAGRNLRNADIAVRLGIREARVERLLARAVRKFDRALEDPSLPRWRLRLR